MANLYEVLGVQKDASQNDIKKVYRKLAVQYHPDKGGDSEKFKNITEAYNTLSNSNKRREYDNQQTRSSHGFGGLGGMFESFFGYARQRQPQQPQPTSDEDITFKLGVTLEQIKKGIKQKIQFQRNKICYRCNGRGGEGKMTCGICRGAGVETVASGRFMQQFSCRTCKGRGILFNDSCNLCEGDGVQQIVESVVVEIKKA
jgi:DnaJ-class molecular chaperone